MGLIHYLTDLLPGGGGGRGKALHGKVVLITGASSGIGRELAIQMHGLSMKVILAARNMSRLEELRKEPSLMETVWTICFIICSTAEHSHHHHHRVFLEMC